MADKGVLPAEFFATCGADNHEDPVVNGGDMLGQPGEVHEGDSATRVLVIYPLTLQPTTLVSRDGHMESLQVLPDGLRRLPHVSTVSMLTLATKETRWAQRMAIVGVGLASFGDVAGDCCICVTIRQSMRVTLSMLL